MKKPPRKAAAGGVHSSVNLGDLSRVTWRAASPPRLEATCEGSREGESGAYAWDRRNARFRMSGGRGSAIARMTNLENPCLSLACGGCGPAFTRELPGRVGHHPVERDVQGILRLLAEPPAGVAGRMSRRRNTHHHRAGHRASADRGIIKDAGSGFVMHHGENNSWVGDAGLQHGEPPAPPPSVRELRTPLPGSFGTRRLPILKAPFVGAG